MNLGFTSIAICLVLLGSLAHADKLKPVDISKIPLPAARKVDFATEIHPIFKEACFKCHGPEKQKGKYRMDTKAGAFKDTDYGPTIIPGQSEKSSLIHMVCNLIDEMMMPPPSDKPGESEPLSKDQIGLIRAWIDQGAEWPDGPIADVVKPVTFSADIGPLFEKKCAECHSSSQSKGGFRVDSLASLLKGGENYGTPVKPGQPDKSALITIVSGKDEDLPLPEKHRLLPKEIELVRRWIEQGAK